MKFDFCTSIVEGVAVAPFVGAWIEICVASPPPHVRTVAPFVGAWIEITEDETDDEDE